MNYEELYAALTPLEKELKDAAAAVTRHQKAVSKHSAAGNLTEMKKSLDSLAESIAQLAATTETVKDEADGFDTKAYFLSGDFTRQMLEECEKLGIDVKGEKGVYEMFPYKVRVYAEDEHAEEVWIDRKKFAGFRPSALAAHIRAGQEKLYKAKFNETSFMNELADAYDTTCLVTGTRPGTNLMLTKIYNTMTPMARSRKEYDRQAFAFDLARLYELGPEKWVTKAGRQFTFGTSRDGKTGIRVLSSTGVESYINTLRPLATEE